MKTCFKCHQAKELSEFYKHPAMGDGYLGKCKQCTKADSGARYAVKRLDPEWMRKERSRNREKNAAYRARGVFYPKSPGVQRKWQLRNPYKRKAHCAANNAMRRGLLLKPKSCQGCLTETAKLQKHHPDYSMPLHVLWLCTKCHGIAHRKDQAAA